MARFTPLRVTDLRHETVDCISVGLQPPAERAAYFRFLPGQHLVLRRTIGGEELRRTYSICSGIDDQELRIAVKRQPGGRFSSFVAEELRRGDLLDAMPPAGRFTLEPHPEKRRRIMAFAAGSGITPVISILRSILSGEPRSHVTLIYGSREISSIIFREQLEDLKNQHMTALSLLHVLSGESGEAEISHGRIDADKVRAVCRAMVPTDAIDAWLVCGPAPMIQTVTDTLLARGVEQGCIHFEYFTPRGNRPRPARRAPEPGLPEGASTRLGVILDGQRSELHIAHADASILDAARRQGLDVPFSCTAGVCCTCRAKLIEGRVDMAANYALEEAEVEAGFILTCQARPLTEHIVVDYDHS